MPLHCQFEATEPACERIEEFAATFLCKQERMSNLNTSIQDTVDLFEPRVQPSAFLKQLKSGKLEVHLYSSSIKL